MFIGLTPLGINSALMSLSIPFTPLALFATGQQGAWWEPSDFTSLFQDVAGSVPVTSVEQPVAVMLDKRFGLVRGPELVTGQTWSSSGVGAVGGVNRVTFVAATAGSGGASAMIIANKLYEITYTISGIMGGSIGLDVGGGAAVQRAANGSYTERKYASASGILTASCAGTVTDGVFTINSCKLIDGNHVKVVNSVVSARVNLLTKTEQFDDVAWAKVGATVTLNSTTAPDGTNTATTFTGTASGSSQYMQQTAGKAIDASAYSFFLKAGTVSAVRLYRYNLRDGSNIFGDFNLVTGTATASAWAICTITPQPSGFYLCTVSGPIPAALAADGAAIVVYADTGTFFIWHPQLETGFTATTYQRVNTAIDYNTVGFPKYLTFNGSSSAAQTFGSIDFSATDKMTVWAGVRKLSDAATGFLVETSVDTSNNNGAFAVRAPSAGAGTYGVALRGTVTGPVYTTGAGFSAPITNVLAYLADTAAATPSTQMMLRVNMVSQSLSAQIVGPTAAGNFGNYPLFIGARNAASLFFNGNLYDLIVRGAASTANEIAATEMYVNSKTGAY